MSEDLVLRPTEQTPDVFDRLVRGYYGTFKTDKSFRLSYVQASMPIDSINWLETASEAFRASNLDFEELVQRDIDKKRVIDIVEDYLKEGQDKVIFFPPLLVSLVALSDDGILTKYENFDERKLEHSIEQTWGGDRFQLIVPTNERPTGHHMEINGRHVHLAPYWSVLRLNSNKIKLVVIDGQHRLQALKSLWNSNESSNKNVVRQLSIPVCILFSPDAVQGFGGDEQVNRDMRELFVTINSEGKKVSGHFISLLNDNRLSSYAIREFCNYAKSIEIQDGLTNLHCVEWNQRVDRFAAQINRSYSITTIQIISDALSEHAFDPKTGGRTRYLLNLRAFTDDLEKPTNAIPVDELSEQNFRISQVKVLRELIKSKVAPALGVLFFEPSIYKQRIQATGQAATWLAQEMIAGIDGAEHCKQSILDQYRDANELDPSASRVHYKDFERLVEESSPSAIFFYNVFQQGLIRVWISLTRILFESGNDPVTVAKALVEALDRVMTLTDPRFESSNAYTQKLLYNGGNVLLSKRAKDNWERLILINFMNKGVRSTFTRELNDSEYDHDEIVATEAEKALQSYLSALQGQIRGDYYKYWRDKELDEQIMAELEDLDAAAQREEEGAEERFDEIIEGFVMTRFKDAERKLRASFGI